jgi:hypothetical protein
MPRATVDMTATERFELKTLPAVGDEEAGWIEVRKLSYGQILARRDMATKMAIEGVGGNMKRDDDIKVTTDIIQKAVTEFEFKNCIVNHNLEDATGKKLNFGNPASVVDLDPRVGQEISALIDSINQWDEDLSGKDEPNSETELELV